VAFRKRREQIWERKGRKRGNPRHLKSEKVSGNIYSTNDIFGNRKVGFKGGVQKWDASNKAPSVLLGGTEGGGREAADHRLGELGNG